MVNNETTDRALKDLGRRGRPGGLARLDPAQQQAVQKLRLQVQARLGAEITNSDLLQQFFRQHWPAFQAALVIDGGPRL